MENVYRTIAKLIPPPLKKKLQSLLSFSTIKITPEVFIGFILLMSILFGTVAGFFLGILLQKSFWVIFFTTTVITNLVIYFWIALLVDKKARLIEEALPDALQLMASNLRAGMTPEKSLLLSSRPEFGPLKEEIDIVGRKVTLGKNVGAALTEMAERVRSRRLVRAVELINSGLESGGSLAILLEATAQELRAQFLIDKKIKASITMYVIFIFSAAGFISPILFGLSSFLVEVLRSSFSQITIPTTAIASIPIHITEISITNEFLLTFIIVFLTVNSFFSSLLLGLIGKGKGKEGFRYFIPMIIVALSAFLLSRYAIKTVLGSLFNF